MIQLLIEFSATPDKGKIMLATESKFEILDCIEWHKAKGIHPVAVLFDDLTNPGDRRVYRATLEETAEKYLSPPKYDPRFHTMLKVEWSDGGKSWASPRWDAKQTTLYLRSACDSTMVIIRRIP